MSLETDLRQALKRRTPASGFDERVMSRIAAGESPRVHAGTSWMRRVSLPIAASLMLAFGATYYLHQEHERQAAEAHAQTARTVVLALQIASKTVSAAQAKVQEITRYEPTNDH